MLRLKRNLKIVIIIMLIMLFQFFWLSPVKATEDELEKLTTEVKEDTSNYSEAYKEYLKLSDEEKSKLGVIPRKYNISLDSIYEDTVTVKESPSLYNLFGLFSESKVTSTYAEELPESFNLRDEITIPSKNQGDYGLCWAFTSLRCLETNLALNNYGQMDFSEIHLDWLSTSDFGTSRAPHSGGNFSIFEDYGFHNRGPVFEEDAPYTNNYENEGILYLQSLESEAYLMETINFPTIDKRNETYSDEELRLFREKVKRHIMENGSVYASINSNYLNVGGFLYNTETKNNAPHAVSIIGWNDNYSKVFFQNEKEEQPQNDGAWIALNSWGDYVEIIYISYEDYFVEEQMSGVIQATTDINEVGIQNVKFEDIELYNIIKEKLGESVITSNDEELMISSLKNANIIKIDINGARVRDYSGLENYNCYRIELNEFAIANEISEFNFPENIDSLEGLYLRGNQIVDISFLEKFKNYKNLKTLDLRGNQIRDLTPIKQLNSLTYLNLSENRIRDIKPIEQLTNLEHLVLSYNGITDITALSQLNKLTNLDLTDNNISDIIPLSNLVNLNELYMSCNNIKEISGLRNMNKLIRLSLDGNEISDVNSIGLLTELKHLNLNSNNITDIDSFANLIEIISLNINDNKISDISALTNLTQLRNLDITNNIIETTINTKINETVSIKLPPIIIEAMKEDSLIHSDIKYVNCTNNENNIVINANENILATAHIVNGDAAGTKFKVNVEVKKGIESISIKNEPELIYIKGSELDLSDGIITVKYDDGSTEDIEMSDSEVTVTGYDKNKIGNQTLTVTYQEKTTEMNVTVKNDLLEVVIENLPKETYIKGEELDLTNGIIIATYEDGSSEDIEMTNSEVTVTGYDKDKMGSQTLIVTYKEKTTEMYVTVKNDVREITIVELPKTTYIKGEEFDLTDGKILVKYEDGSSEEKLMTDQGISWGLYQKDKLGEQTITVEYKGKSAQYTITVIEKFSFNFGEYEIKEEENVSYIQNILSNTTKKDLIENIETNGVIEIYKDTEKIENEDTKLATGMELRITHNNVQRTYKIVVLGDITGDGIVDQLDLLMFARYKAGFEEEVEKVKGANLLATDIVKNNNVAEDIDLLKLARILVNLDDF